MISWALAIYLLLGTIRIPTFWGIVIELSVGVIASLLLSGTMNGIKEGVMCFGTLLLSAIVSILLLYAVSAYDVPTMNLFSILFNCVIMVICQVCVTNEINKNFNDKEDGKN